MRGFGMRRLMKLASVAALVAMQCLVPSTASAHPAANTNSQTQSCSLNNGIQHVISMTFDNTHLTRDRAGIVFDLEQMPNLLNFMTSNGSLIANNHTIRIAHTSRGTLPSLSRQYPDRPGLTAPN